MNTNVDVEKLDGGEEQQNEYAAARGARFADGQSLAEYTTNASEKAGSSRYAGSESGLEHVKASKTAERKLVRKLGAFPSIPAQIAFTEVQPLTFLSPSTDVLILPLAILLYLSAYLDRCVFHANNSVSARGSEGSVLLGSRLFPVGARPTHAFLVLAVATWETQRSRVSARPSFRTIRPSTRSR